MGLIKVFRKNKSEGQRSRNTNLNETAIIGALKRSVLSSEAAF